jgi:hypothetical protein
MDASPVSAGSGLNILIWSIAVMIQLILASQATEHRVSDVFLCAVALRNYFRALCSMSSRPPSILKNKQAWILITNKRFQVKCAKP